MELIRAIKLGLFTIKDKKVWLNTKLDYNFSDMIASSEKKKCFEPIQESCMKKFTKVKNSSEFLI